MSKESRKEFLKSINEQIRSNKYTFILYIILRFIVVAVMVVQFWRGNYENALLCLLALILFIVPSIIESQLPIVLPDILQLSIITFIFASLILGEISAYYITYPHWDTILHMVNGFLAAVVGFSTVDILNRHKRVAMKLSPVFMAMVAFCFSMTIGVMWEFFEYFMDHALLFDMQKDTVVNTIATVALDEKGANKVHIIKNITDVIVVSDGEEISLGLGGYLDIGLVDTMKDLFVNFIGAVVFSVLGYFHVKKRDGKGFMKNLIPEWQEDKEHLEKV